MRQLILFLDGKVNAVVMSTGTGGTLAGTSMYLKEKNSKIRTVLADPPVCR
jgi:cysteine synthase A